MLKRKLMDSSNSDFNLCFLRSHINQGRDKPYYSILYTLVMMVSDLQAATMKMREVIAVIRQPTFKEFALFL